MSRIFEVAMVGCGLAAKLMHAPAYNRLGDVARVTALVDPNEENRGIVREILDCDVFEYSSLDDLMEAQSVDMVDVMLPHNLYASVVPRIASYCGNVLVEKPFATSLEEAEIISEAARGLNFSVVHNYVYGRRYQDAIRRVREGEIGTPRILRMEHLGRGVLNNNSLFRTPWRGDRTQAGESSFNDHGYHLVYLATAIMDSGVVEVTAQMGDYGHLGDVMDPALVILRHANGAMSLLADGLLPYHSERIEEIVGTGGSFVLKREGVSADYFKDFETEDHIDVLKRSPYARSMAACIRDYIDAVQGGTRMPVSLGDARDTLAVVLAAHEAHRQKRVITLRA